jgi:DNA repair ATPase RecN
VKYSQRCRELEAQVKGLEQALADVKAKVPDEFKGYPLDFAVKRMAERLEACRQRLRDDEKEMKALYATQDDLVGQINRIKNFAHEVK